MLFSAVCLCLTCMPGVGGERSKGARSPENGGGWLCTYMWCQESKKGSMKDQVLVITEIFSVIGMCVFKHSSRT